MSRRIRAALFATGTLVCALLAAAAAGSYGQGQAERYGPLRDVVVARVPLRAGQRVTPVQVGKVFELRRVPASFVPPGALGAATRLAGLRSAVAVPTGTYMTTALFRPPESGRKPPEPPSLRGGRSPVEITVTGGEALATIAPRRRQLVDVVVTSDSGPGPSHGRTYVAARGVRLLGLRRERDATGIGGEGGWVATLALTRKPALTLIRAQSFARSIRLLAR